MSKVYLLDCTLRDGGYINDWRFGAETIKGFGRKIAQTGIEIFEVGFIKGDLYDPDKSIFPDTASITNVIQPKSEGMLYVGMIDMSAPIPLDRIAVCDGSSIDGIRIIFKKEKIDEAYEYCKRIQELGYFVCVNFVGTDLYTDKEFIEGIEKFNKLHPFSVSIVDSFGVIKRKQFLRLVYLADNNLSEEIILAYHAHNNLQQAFGNAEALVEMNLKRDLIIDACVFGMGRGAGNLNLELFAEYMNENYDTHYKIEPMLEIMDEYLNDIYKTKFWGYSLPLYLSASTGCHPNYAIYLAEKDSLTVKSFHELLKGIPKDEKAKFSKERAEKYYRKYQENYVDDKDAINQLTIELAGKRVVMLAPGRTMTDYRETVIDECKKYNTVSIAVNFLAEDFEPDYVFSSNMRRFNKIQGRTKAKCITTSNMQDCVQTDYVVNFASFALQNPDIIDNSGLMLLKLLVAVGVKEVAIAGMDGYSIHQDANYYDKQLEYDFSRQTINRNVLISEELKEIQKMIRLSFITPTHYDVQ
ncbi:MAG: aldolase catalytic domain-containing protein [Clostridia bacterium]|nr:aldolase catalytic domain-containing protein [Clostridia bacterium]